MSRGVEAKPEKLHAHYNHTDPCSHLRWTAREAHQYMYQRPWQKVVDFYSDLVRGRAALLDLFPAAENLSRDASSDCLEAIMEPDLTKKTHIGKRGRWERATFKIILSYHGGSFDGWQKQPGLSTVQGVVERSLGSFVDENKAKQLMEKSLPVEPCVLVAGRTDKGVTALRQVCSFYSWRNDINTKDIEEAINNAVPEKLGALHVCKVSRVFHPNFCAKWRRYFYIFPLNRDEETVSFCDSSGLVRDKFDDDQVGENTGLGEGNMKGINDHDDDKDEIVKAVKPKIFCVQKVNKLLQQLEGKSLSYKMFARDTKASRNMGPATECYLFHARAMESILPGFSEVCIEGQKVMCVELVANRFLRKMVRVIVATAVREAAVGSTDDVLLRLMDATCRRATAPPAPPDGLCLVEVGYEEFRKDACLIHS